MNKYKQMSKVQNNNKMSILKVENKRQNES